MLYEGGYYSIFSYKLVYLLNNLYFCHVGLFVFADVMSESFESREDVRGFVTM